MSERMLAPGNVAAAAVVVGGVLVAIQPEHATSVVRLTLLTVAAAAGLYALVVGVPTTWWISPFDRAPDPVDDEGGSRELERIREKLSGRRRRIGADGPSLPADVLRILKPLIEAALERRGLDAAEEARAAGPGSGCRGLAPLTRAVSRADPRHRPPWFRMRRSDPEAVAEAVHRVLDDLERLAGGPVSEHPTDTLHSRAP